MEASPNQAQNVEELFEVQSHLYKHTFNFLSSMYLKCSVQLGIPDIVQSHGQPITLSELVYALHIDPEKSDHIYRLMRLLVHSGIFSATKVAKDEKEEVSYDLTPSSRLLLKENLPNLSPFVQAMLHPAMVHPSQFLGDWFLRNEEPPFRIAFGMSLWEYVSQNQEYNRVFNEGMASDSGMMNLVIKDCKPVFEGLDSLVDVGGGNGGATKIISEAFPHLKCTVLDLPHVIQNLQDSSNIKFVAGDMFYSIPSADATLLKLVFHDYSDEECIKLLKKCKEAISKKGKEGKVIIIDIVINENQDKRELTEAKLGYDVDDVCGHWKRARRKGMGEGLSRSWIQWLQDNTHLWSEVPY